MMWRGILAHRWWWLGGFGVVLLISAGIAVFYVATWRDRLPARADIGGVVLAHKLLVTSQQLQASLTDTAITNPGQTARTYITDMQAIEHDCRGFQTYADRSQNESPKSDTTILITKSASQCQELSKVASDSRKLYQAALPVLTIDAHVKRFQTLPLVSQLERASQLQAINSTVTQVKQAASSMDFSTQAPSLLQQLQTNANASKSFAYLPAVAQFQHSMLVERQRYWASYGDLQNLTMALKASVKNYCNNLPLKDSDNLFECN